uniref:Wu:fj29h11 n=1 Tax=Cyprinus carpio carpio TaxID=630221 RepID=A0A8C1AH32_CYPCA
MNHHIRMISKGSWPSLQTLKEEVVNLIQSFPDGIEVSRLIFMYRRVYGKRFGPLSSYGLEGLQELFDELSDQVRVERIYNKNIIRSVNPVHRTLQLPVFQDANMDDAPKNAIRKKVIKLLKKHPQGIPLNKLPEVFAQKHKQALLPAELGFPSVESFVDSLSPDLLVEDGVIFHKSNIVLTDEDFEKRCRDVVELVKSHQDGIPLSKIAVFYKSEYGRPLKKKELGFSSIAEFIDTLNQELCVENGQIFYRIANPEATTHTATPVHVDGVFKDVVELVKDHPTGIPLRRLSTFFNQKYRRNLAVSEFGFKTIASFVDSLSDELLVEKERVFHKNHRAAPAVPTPANLPRVNNDSTPVNPTSPVVSFGAGFAQRGSEMTQEELMDKVKEVIKKYPAASNSIVQLQNGFFLLFGSALPLDRYMSLYDNHTAKQLSSSCLVVNNKPAGAKCLEIKKVQPMPVVVNEQVVRSKAGSPLLRFQSLTVPSMAAPSDLSASDFPVLGSTLTKAEEKKLKEGRGPVFNESYYSQVRDVHGANVRAAEALLEDEDNVGRRRKAMSPKDVNCLVEDVMRALAAEGEHVTIERVISRVCSLLQVSNLKDMHIDARRHLPAVQELQRSIKEINMFIESVEAVSCICTLYELGQALANLKNKKRFEELHLGPLCKIPLIHRMFKMDANTKDDDVHQIATVDILRSLRMFRRKSKTPRIDLADFMKHLADQYSCESPYELGIRIQSLGLPISTLNKASAAEFCHMDTAREAIQKEIQEEVDARMYKIKKSLLDPAQGPVIFSQIGNSELRKKYANMTAADAVMEVFINSESVFNKSMTKTIQTFLLSINRDRLARALFQLAICCGSLDAPQDLVAKEKPQKKAEAKKSAEERATEMLPTEADVKSYFQECVTSFKSTPTLAHLRTLEKRIAEKFKFKDFSQLQQGTFLDFIFNNKKVLQEAAGGAVSIDSQDPGMNGFRPCRQDVFEFIKQCGEGDDSRLPFIEAALRNHYRIRDSRELGHGPLSFLVNYTQKQKELGGDAVASVVRYECPLLPMGSGECVVDSVGLLGEVSRDQARASLLSAPLLQDLEEWSQWQLVFQPNHGPLKDFIDKYCGKTELLALEVSPGVLLRVTADTGDKHFSEATQALDPVGTAGHLVSIVVAYGIPNTPTALLANHMESALNVAVAQEGIRPGEDGYSYGRVAQFVLECVALMPTRICKELLQQVFLEPLSKVLGQTRSKTLLLDAARSHTRYLNKLHQMGLLLGITEWRSHFNDKLLLPAPPQLPSEIKKVWIPLFLLDDDDGDDDDDDDDEDEQMYELVSEHTKETDSSEDEDRENSATADQPDEEVNTELDQHKAVIEDIRKTEFGIGVELNEEGQNLMRKQQARLGRSLERLSTELYSKDTHFVLELIQNADDNCYPDGREHPALAFVVERDCITILNNECGFEENNVRAICDVGRSTKGKHKYGYIGQKGIGFKSVFKVTDCPEIHSNGFHIRFDKNSGPMGYILPHWVEQERAVSAGPREIAEQRWATKIHLPLRSESYQTKNLFHDVHPSLLLFLHRLRSISIFNEAEKRFVSMTRRDLSHNILEVAHTGGEERWLVVKTMLYPKKIKEDVESTELALAFQLSDSSSCDVKPQKQPVFAFLPLRSFGFRFIIQGDFDIPSSREDVDRDSSWNQWLRSEIPQLFVHAMDVFSQHPEFSGLGGLCYFMQFIPQPSEILDFFNPVANQIIQLLKGKACLPAKEDSEGRVEFKQPSQLAVCQDRLIQDVIGGEDLCRNLSLSYLHPALQSRLSSSLLTALGVHRLRANEIITVTCAMARELVQHEPDLKKLARLLVCDFRALEPEYEVDALLQSLRDVPMIPLANGSVVSLSSEGVFFPLSDVTQAQTDLQALYQDLNIVEPRLLACLDELGNSQVRELLRRLNVHELEPQQVLQQHIYPLLRSKAWEKKPEDIVISYLVFIKLHSQDQDYRSLVTNLPVLTNKGFLCPAEHKIHFSKEYGNIHLPSVLPGVDWVLLDACYLRADRDASGWRDFFSALGVRDLLIFRKEKRTFNASSPWAEESKLWSRPADGPYVIEDQHCAEFHTLATADHLTADSKLQQRQALISLLDKNWDTGEKYSQYLRVQVCDSQGRSVREVRSSFYHHLTQLSWVPARRPPWDESRPVSYLQPNSVYIFSAEVHQLLGSHVDYAHGAQMPSEFTRAIGMRHTVHVKDMIGYLKRWCVKVSENPSEDPEGADFTTTVNHIHTVYRYLSAECTSTELRDLFQHAPAVFIEEDDWCSGRFYHLKEVCWSDPTGMFHRYKELIRRADSGIQEPRVLAPFYNHLEDMKKFFKSLSVEPSPSMKKYVSLLEAVCEASPLATGDVVQDVSVIFAKLADICKFRVHGDQDQDTQLNPVYCSSLKDMVSRKRVFPTKTSGWVTLACKPMIADSANLEKIFKSHGSVCLLNLPSAAKRAANKSRHEGKQEKEAFSERDRELFLEICGVERLSRRVTTEPQTENYRPCPAVQTLVRQLVPYIQRFIFHNADFDDVYSELKESGIAKCIRSLSFGQVGKLYIHYRLEVPDENTIYESEDIICLLKDKKELYIHKDHLSAKLDICRELVKLFTTDKSFAKELERFLQGLVTCVNDQAALKRFLDRENARELPANEEPWEVPAPVEVKAETIVSSLVRPSGDVQEEEMQTQHNKEDRLVCWPPKASLSKTGGSSSGSQAVEEVMKMWPPPAAPATPGLERSSSNISVHQRTAESPLHTEPRAQHEQSPRASSFPPRATERREESAVQDVQSVVSPQQPVKPNAATDEGEETTVDKTNPPPAADDDHSTLQSQNPAQAPEIVLSQFQGAEALQRPPMTLDSAVWSKAVAPEEVLEDLPLDCTMPQTLVLPKDKEDTGSIGQWGEQLVHSFLTHWRENGGPSQITWFNEKGESGRACDFKLTFTNNGSTQEVFVEVKTTVRRDRHFIHMSANELDLALKEKERYHIYRVYGAGDAQHVRLCRIKNLAQHLHSKSLELFLFV